MRIEDVLQSKGREVATVAPDTTVAELLGQLAEHRVGALVVSESAGTLDGIVSERDVVRRLHSEGVQLLERPVAEIMTVAVRTCGPEDAVEDVMRVMTEHRIRHLPVQRDGDLVGLVSIGDLVKHRIDELETERRQLTDYISG